MPQDSFEEAHKAFFGPVEKATKPSTLSASAPGLNEPQENSPVPLPQQTSDCLDTSFQRDGES